MCVEGLGVRMEGRGRLCRRRRRSRRRRRRSRGRRRAFGAECEWDQFYGASSSVPPSLAAFGEWGPVVVAPSTIRYACSFA